MTKKSLWRQRGFALFFMAFGFLFGAHWKNEPLCLGGKLFSFFGLSAWSNGTEGTHYPGIIGWLLFLGGLAFFAYTTKKKGRTYLFFFLAFVLLQFLLSFSA